MFFNFSPEDPGAHWLVFDIIQHALSVLGLRNDSEGKKMQIKSKIMQQTLRGVGKKRCATVVVLKLILQYNFSDY